MKASGFGTEVLNSEGHYNNYPVDTHTPLADIPAPVHAQCPPVASERLCNGVTHKSSAALFKSKQSISELHAGLSKSSLYGYRSECYSGVLDALASGREYLLADCSNYYDDKSTALAIAKSTADALGSELCYFYVDFLGNVEVMA